MKAPLDSRQLRAFVTLAKTESFTLAAKALFLSQSAISHSIKALEEDAGCLLLHRLGKKVSLTQAGEQLLHHAEKILAEMDTARSSLENLGKWGQSRLRIGASQTACRYILPAVLRQLKEKFPHCRLSIEPGDTSDSLESIRSQEIDLALVMMPHEEKQFEFHPLFTDEMVFLTDPLHPWAIAGSVTRSEIPRQNYILYSKASYTFRMVEEYFRAEKMVLNTVIELGSMEATKEFVKLGLGVSILAPWIAQKELQEKSLVALPLGKRKLKRTWGIACWRGRPLNLAQETFIGLCRKVADGIATQERQQQAQTS